MGLKGALLAVVTLVATALPAQAHSSEELDQYRDAWIDRASEDDGPTWKMVLEFRDMMERHPWYSAWSPPVVTRATELAQTGSSHSGMGTNVEQWRSLVSAYFPAAQVDKAMAVMACESGGNPNADNPSSSAAGLFQFLKSTWDNMVPLSVTGGSYASGQVYNPEANVRAAAWLWAAEGWSQWSCA